MCFVSRNFSDHLLHWMKHCLIAHLFLNGGVSNNRLCILNYPPMHVWWSLNRRHQDQITSPNMHDQITPLRIRSHISPSSTLTSIFNMNQLQSDPDLVGTKSGYH
eukprot:sb/3477930/